VVAERAAKEEEEEEEEEEESINCLELRLKQREMR
jgi:hypothetical protein